MMDGKKAVGIIKSKFKANGALVKIPLQNGREIKAQIVEGGLDVDNLGRQPYLPWNVFEETVNLLTHSGGKAERGDALGSKLGDRGLPLDSIEGYIAFKVYGKEIGDSVFRRITPIAAILVWAGICETAPGQLILYHV